MDDASRTKPAGIEAFLSRLDGLRPAGDGRWTANCPAHNDKSPSLSVRDTGEKILFYCFAGCHSEEVLAAIGLTWNDLFCDPWKASYVAACHRPLRLPPIDPVGLERRIVQIARSDLSAGKILSLEDEARLTLAVDRLELANG